MGDESLTSLAPYAVEDWMTVRIEDRSGLATALPGLLPECHQVFADLTAQGFQLMLIALTWSVFFEGLVGHCGE